MKTFLYKYKIYESSVCFGTDIYIKIMFKEKGRFRPYETRIVRLDSYALWKFNKYYPYDELDDYFYGKRLEIIRNLIDQEFGGSVHEYATDLIRYEIVNWCKENRQDMNEKEITMSLVTHGWVKSEMEVDDSGKSEEK